MGCVPGQNPSHLTQTEEAFPVFRSIVRYALGAAFLLGLLARAPGQEKQPPPVKDQPPSETPKKDPYKEYFKEPRNIDEFWEALQFELKAGEHELAARHLHGLLDKKPTGEDLNRLENESGGIRAFLRLRSVPKWSDDEKVDKQARKDAEELLYTLGRFHTDPARIDMFVRNLGGDADEHTPEERAFAVRELKKAGAVAVPPLIEALRPTTGEERRRMVAVLTQLGPEAVAPMLGALDIPDNALRADLIHVMFERAEASVVPYLWYFTAASNSPEPLRAAATTALSRFLQTPVDKLPPAKAALTREAEQYYYHKKLKDDAAVAIWRWDGKALVQGWPGSPTVPVGKAEEYYGLKFARQALDLDSAYEPAQILFLSLALDKAASADAGGKATGVNQLLATVNPELLNAVLERALTDRRSTVAIAAIKGLADLAEARANRPRSQGQPALVRALHYPNRSVQLAAAEALIHIPGPSQPLAGARVVEVLRRIAAAEPAENAAPKVVVGFFNQDMGNEVGKAVKAAGMEPVHARTGNDVLRRVSDAADIDAILIDANLPDPGPASLIAQLRADINVGELPLILAAPKERLDALRKYIEKYRNVAVIPAPQALDPETLKLVLADPRIDAPKPLTEAEHQQQVDTALRLLAGLARKEPPGYDVQSAAEALINGLRLPKLADGTVTAIITAIGRVPGAKSQRELAAFVLSGNRPPALRSLAAAELVRHIQQHSLSLAPAQVNALIALANDDKTDAALKAKAMLVEGVLRPDARVTGDRLKDYQTPEPTAIPPTKAPGEDKEPPKEKAPQKDT
jgi:hypothetical protein